MLRLISERGPIKAAAIVAELGLTETAVRRHLDNLQEAQLIEPRESHGSRGRGRPARSWVVSTAGHRALVSDYDDLAGDALRFLADTLGDDAVAAFAARRVADLEGRYAARLAAVGSDPAARANASRSSK